jgi:hypothetical protein
MGPVRHSSLVAARSNRFGWGISCLVSLCYSSVGKLLGCFSVRHAARWGKSAMRQRCSQAFSEGRSQIMAQAKDRSESDGNSTALFQATPRPALFASSGSSLSLSRVASGLLRQEQDAGHNKPQKNAGGRVAAECKTAVVNWLVEQIA